MGQKQRHVVFQGASKLENSTIRAIAVEFVYSLKQDNYFSFAKFTVTGLTRLTSLMLAVRTNTVVTAPKESNNDFFHL